MKGKRILIFSILLVLVATLAPVDGNMAGRYLDKVAHVILYGVLGVSILLTYDKTSTALHAFLLAALMGLVIEVIQHYIPGRNTSMYDGIANTIGLLLATVLFDYMNMSSSSGNENPCS